MAPLLPNLKKERINCHISTSCNATGVLWVSKEAENSNNARLFGLVCYFSPKPEKTLKNCPNMGAFVSIFWLFKDFFILVGKISTPLTYMHSFQRTSSNFDTCFALSK